MSQTTQSRVTVRPATLNRFTATPVTSTQKRRVAAYARVSTDLEEQQTSYAAQVAYYTEYIKKHDEWEFAGMYADEGISATSTKKRDGFNKMVRDALDGNIDLIVTKSVSRFARNTVDSLTTVRRLKDKGVEIYFEKENIYTLDSKGELLITIMSSLAQEESRSISENVAWGMHRRFAEGKVAMPYKQFLGYCKGSDGKPAIVPEEAETVRWIYQLFLEGKNVCTIRQILMSEGIHSPAGKKEWQTSTIRSILSNEKYKGDAVLQKTFCTDYLTKKMKKNEGELPQYYVSESHPAIISSEVFDMAQEEMRDRKRTPYRSNSGCFSGKIICGSCGSLYGSKVWHSNLPNRKIVYQCNAKYHNVEICRNPHLYETEIKQAFLHAINQFLADRQFILDDAELIISTLADMTVVDQEIVALGSPFAEMNERNAHSIIKNPYEVEDHGKRQRQRDGLINRCTDPEDHISPANEERKLMQASNIRALMRKLSRVKAPITTFSEPMWNALIDHATIAKNGVLTFTLRNGMSIE